MSERKSTRKKRDQLRLNDDQGIAYFCRVAAECCPDRPVWQKSCGIPLDVWLGLPANEPRLSLADGLAVRRLKAEGPWRVLVDERKSKQHRLKCLIADLETADRLLQVPGDHGRGAAIAAVEALLEHADIGLRRTPAVSHLLNALADAQHGIPNPFWDQSPERREGKPSARTLQAEFIGEVAGILQVLAIALGRQKLTEALSGHAGRPVRALAGKMAKRLGMAWNKRTAESLYARVVGPKKSKALVANPGLKFDWRRLSASRNFMPAELGNYPRERLRFLEVLRFARHATDRGEDMKLWCKRRSEIVFSIARLPGSFKESFQLPP